MNRRLAVYMGIAILLVLGAVLLADRSNIVHNPDFEMVSYSAPSDWVAQAQNMASGATVFDTDKTQKHSGNTSVLVVNNSPNYASYLQMIRVKKNSYYKLSCWIKTDNVGMGKKGAYIFAEGENAYSKDIKGTGEGWKYVEFYGKTGMDQIKLSLGLALGSGDSLNTGRAWFDDVVVEHIKSPPVGTKAVKLNKEGMDYTKMYDRGNSSDLTFIKLDNYRILVIVFAILFLIISVALYGVIKKRSSKIRQGDERLLLYFLLGSGLILRLLVAPSFFGFPWDIRCWMEWASAASRDIFGVYSMGDIIPVDYPPVYMYILFVLGKIMDFLGANLAPWLMLLILKLPSMVADMVTAYMLYRLSKRHLTAEMGFFVAGIYIFNPAVLVNSTLWGQADSFFTLIVISAILLLDMGRINYSSILFAVLILMKPQGIIFLPILFFELWKKKEVKNFITAFVYGMGTVIVVILPYMFTEGPLWIFKLYPRIISGYPYASVNAFNLFNLMGGNWKNDAATLFVFSYKAWGFIFIVLITAFTAFLHLKMKGEGVPFVAAMFIITGVFLFSLNMHERYVFPSLALTLAMFVYLKDERILLLFAGFSATAFLNTNEVLFGTIRYNGYIFQTGDILPAIGSFANIMLFVCLIDILLGNRKGVLQ